MIRYRLQCRKGHQFEAWFSSSTDYDKQAKRGLVTCPDCGTSKVSKTLMAPGVATRKGKRSAPVEPVPAPQPGEGQSQPAAPSDSRVEMQDKFLALMRELRKEVEKKADYVGPRFAEEARKIYYKEAESRGIWGEATLKEAKELVDEGIDCLPLPVLPEDKN